MRQRNMYRTPKWSSPQEKILKINVDGATTNDLIWCSCLFVRDAQGKVLAALGLTELVDTVGAKAWGILQGIKLEASYQSPAVVEGDE